jgi:hypothetical protein
MTRKRIVVLTLASLAGVAAVTLGAYLYHRAEVERQRHSWSVQITPTGGETTVIQLDMRKSHETLKRQLLAALQPLLDDAPAPDGPETVLGTFQCTYSFSTSGDALWRKYGGPEDRRVTFTHGMALPMERITANTRSPSPWVAHQVSPDGEESWHAGSPTGEGLLDMLADRSCARMAEMHRIDQEADWPR